MGGGFLCDLQQHTFDVLKYIEIAETYNANASCCQERSPIFILLLSLACVMLSTIEFNAKLAVMAVEIEDVGTYRLLTPEFQSKQLAIAPNLPQELFRIRLILAQPTCGIEKFRV